MYFNSVVPVTVVIPCFKCVSTINFAITSIIQQTQKPDEVILVDGASCNNTGIMHKIANQYSVWVKLIGSINNQDAVNTRHAGIDNDEWYVQYFKVVNRAIG